MEYALTRSEDYLEHYGVTGQQWGVRRYQNPDGSLTEEGKERYGEQRGWEARQMYKRGTISKEEMRERMGPRGSSAIDYMITGKTRRLREFQRRHEQGYKTCSTVMGAIGGVGMGAIMGLGMTGRVSLGAAAVGAVLGGAAGAAGGYAGQAVNNRINRVVIEKGYNADRNKIRG